MWIDPFVDELYAIREAHAKRFNLDADAIFEDWLKKQQNSGRHYISFSRQTKKVAESSSKYHTNKEK